MRVFVAIDIPESIRKEIRKVQDSLPEFTGKKTESENLHLTLKFLGEIDEEKARETAKRLKRALFRRKKLKKIKFNSFETEIDEIGIFDNRRSRVYPQNLIVWLHMTNCDELQKKIDESLKGIFEPERRFMSHLTIARVKGIKGKDKKRFIEKLKAIKIPKIKFDVKNFRLKKSVLTSKGSVYITIGEYGLQI